jgi:hypothetical protein
MLAIPFRSLFWQGGESLTSGQVMEGSVRTGNGREMVNSNPHGRTTATIPFRNVMSLQEEPMSGGSVGQIDSSRDGSGVGRDIGRQA